MKPSKFPFQSDVYEEKTAENYWNCYVDKKRIVSKLSNILIPNLNSITWIKIMSKIHVPIFYTYRKISREKVSRSGRVGPLHRFKWFSDLTINETRLGRYIWLLIGTSIVPLNRNQQKIVHNFGFYYYFNEVYLLCYLWRRYLYYFKLNPSLGYLQCK